jgi:hypothetical protein
MEPLIQRPVWIFTGALLLGLPFFVTRALAERPFSAEDAANIDWAWKNCETASTDKEHSLADGALAKGGAAYSKVYDQSYRKISDQTPSPLKTSQMCDRIKGLYGSSGTRISGLIVSKPASDVPPSTSPTPMSGTSKSERHGRRRGGMQAPSPAND